MSRLKTLRQEFPATLRLAVPLVLAELGWMSMAMFSSLGLPGLNGFVGEFLILAGSFQSNPTATVIAATGVILAAVYLLWLVQKVFFGPITNEENRNVPDIAWNEIAALVPIVVLMVWIGVYPNAFLKKMEPSVKELLLVVKSEAGGHVMVAASADPSPASGRRWREAPDEGPHPRFADPLPQAGEGTGGGR